MKILNAVDPFLSSGGVAVPATQQEDGDAPGCSWLQATNSSFFCPPPPPPPRRALEDDGEYRQLHFFSRYHTADNAAGAKRTRLTHRQTRGSSSGMDSGSHHRLGWVSSFHTSGRARPEPSFCPGHYVLCVRGSRHELAQPFVKIPFRIRGRLVVFFFCPRPRNGAVQIRLSSVGCASGGDKVFYCRRR